MYTQTLPFPPIYISDWIVFFSGYYNAKILIIYSWFRSVCTLISRYINIKQIQAMFIFPAGIYTLTKQMKKEMKCYQYPIERSIFFFFFLISV